MQSRKFFTFGANFNILLDPIYVVSPNRINLIPPVSDYLIYQNENNMITQDNNYLITN